MEEKKSSSNKSIIIILALLLLGALGYTYYTSGEHKKLTDQIEEEKVEIEGNLDSMILKYEDAIAQKTSMSNELSIERDRIIALRDSIKGLKSSNYSLIRRYRREIAKLEQANKKLFMANDSLTSANELLTIDLDSANVKITEQIAKYDTLTIQNQELIQKVAIGSVLKVNKAKVISMRERNNGKLVETSRARNTDAFRINFTIDKNEITTQGTRNVYVQIINAKGQTIAPKGELVLSEELAVKYSDNTTVDYVNEAIDVISLVEVDRDEIQKGPYTVNIYVENKFAGTTQIILK
ncbi:hypothetical protein SAMN05444411_11359 [Lutibacter oricola]|uniref:Chromosome partitioning protein ParA n=1 Tax=Lutibacter oricola TaxID=762486 RepID=A0A1H3G6S0_9FLAO|nr:hypothetical protein [Lutibacter oricola]SDX98747.1 hypothetical protein SAMN05444411_11359 [Lutibacter oricola]